MCVCVVCVCEPMLCTPTLPSVGACSLVHFHSTFFVVPPDIHIVLDDKPSLSDLLTVTLDTVAIQWEEVAAHLGIEQCLVDMVKKNNPLCCRSACQSILNKWLACKPYTGSVKRCWSSVLVALERSGYWQLAWQLRASSKEAAH